MCKKHLLQLLLTFPFLSLVPIVAEHNQESTLEFTQMVSDGIFSISDYGIEPNSDKDAVPAIFNALKAAKSYVKQTKQIAEIFIPTGQYFVSQFTLEGLENINLHLGNNAHIYAYPKNSAVDSSDPYITIKSCTNCIIYGEPGSFLDGNGSSWWLSKKKRPDFISLVECSNYELYGFAVNNSPNHTIKLANCKNGKIHDLSIVSPPDSPNTDGIDPMSNVDGLEIYNCFISCGDDNIAINAHFGKMNNIHIHDCNFLNGHGLSFGSAINYDITNVLVENVTIEGTWDAIRFKFSESDRKAKLKNIKFINITAKNLTRDAIKVTTEYSDKPNSKVVLEDISITNFTCKGAARALSLLLTNKKQAITPLILNNVLITEVQKKDIIENYPIKWVNQPS